jgi:hypothetical protein
MRTTQVFMWVSKFKSGVTSAEDANTPADVHWCRKQTKSVSSEGHSPQKLSNKSATSLFCEAADLLETHFDEIRAL